MSTPSRVATVAEMQGRGLLRRHVALGLLVARPLRFYGALAGRHIRQLRKEIERLQGVVRMAVSGLRLAGADLEANRVERALRGR